MMFCLSFMVVTENAYHRATKHTKFFDVLDVSHTARTRFFIVASRADPAWLLSISILSMFCQIPSRKIINPYPRALKFLTLCHALHRS